MHLNNPISLFVQVGTKEKFFIWAEKVLVPNLYSVEWYNGQAQYWRMKYLTEDKAFVRVGPPRFRHMRVKDGGCHILPQISLQSTFKCHKTLTTSNYDEKSYLEGWAKSADQTNVDQDSPWAYKDMFELKAMPFVGVIASYGGGGYIAELGNNPDTANSMIAYLKNTTWLDRRTRAVFVDFNLYNPNVNLFTLASLLIEFPATGGTVPFLYRSKTIKLYPYVGSKFLFRVMLEMAFLVFTLYYVVAQVKLLRKERRKYFRGFWNYWEMINISAFIATLVLYSFHKIIGRLTLNNFHDTPRMFNIIQLIQYHLVNIQYVQGDMKCFCHVDI